MTGYRIGLIQSYDLNYKGVRSTVYHFPGIVCSVGIFGSVFLHEGLRGQGLGSAAHQHRLQYAKSLGFKYVMCSVRRDNDVQHHILKKFGWKEIGQTDTYCHAIVMYERHLDDIEFSSTVPAEVL